MSTEPMRSHPVTIPRKGWRKAFRYAGLALLINSFHFCLRASVTTSSYFRTDGRHIVSASTGESFSFRGIILSGPEYGTFFDNPYPGTEGTDFFSPRPQDFVHIRELGFNVVRIPFEWARLVPGWQPGESLPDLLEPSYLNLLDNLVGEAEQQQISVILDMHDFLKYWPGLSQQACVDDSVEHQALLGRTWELLADHYSDSTVVLGYDIMNEPVREEVGEPCSSCNWHAIAQTVVDAIRMVDENHLIFVEGPSFSLSSSWPIENGKVAFILDSIDPPRIVYSPHVYFDFDNDSRYDDPGEENGPVGLWQHYARDRILPAIYWSIDNEAPILFGETNVPCEAGWATVLDHAFRDFFDPMHISVLLWQYIDPDHCPLGICPLNLLACPQEHQLTVLQSHPGGRFDETDTIMPTPVFSLIYGDARVNPWDAGDGFFDSSPFGIEVDFCSTENVFEGSCSLRTDFSNSNFAAIKLAHQFGLDTLEFDVLTFQIWLTGSGQQDFKIFTTAPRSDCDPGPDPVYPPTFADQPLLSQYLPNPLPGQWQKVEIPLRGGAASGPVVDPDESIINGIALQNIGVVQSSFYLDDIQIIRSSIFADGFESGDASFWTLSVP